MTTMRRRRAWAGICRSSRTTTVRRPIGSSTASAPSRATTPAIRPAVKSGLYDQPFVDTFIHHALERRADHRRPVRRSLSARREGHLRPGQLEHETISAAFPARAARRARTCSPASTSSRSPSKSRSTDVFPNGIPHNGTAQAELDRQPAPRLGEHQPSADADRRCQQHHHRPQGIRRLGAGRPQRPAALQRRPRRDAASDAVPAHDAA